MKRIFTILGLSMLATQAFTQTDTIPVQKDKRDTLDIGNIRIIKSPKKEGGDATTVVVGRAKHSSKKKSNISTNWFTFDLGFANVNDQTNYASAEAMAFVPGATNPALSKDDFRLRTGKSSNVNIWIFTQKLNISKHYLNLKYGMGLEMYNFRYKSNISYLDRVTPIAIRDTVSFSKNKLAADYLTVPLLLNFTSNPDNEKKGISLSAGVSAGYLYASRNKQISSERGKQKTKDDFNLDKWRVAYIGELGLGPVRLYGSYSINTLHSSGLDQTPYAVGIRFSNF